MDYGIEHGELVMCRADNVDYWVLTSAY